MMSVTPQVRQLVKVGLSISLITLGASCTTTSINRSVTKPATPSQPVVALVLGGGGAKGFAHIGVIKTLEASGVQPDLIVGSSVGSFVGSLYASGMSASQLEHLALTTKDQALTDFTLSHQGIIEGIKLKNFVNSQVGGRPIKALPIRFAAVATEKHSGQKAVFSQGNTGLIVQASCSVPNIFIAPRIPEKIGKKFIDGGVSSLVPVDTARALGADVVIAVDVLGPPNQSPTSSPSPSNQRNIWSLIDQSYAKIDNYRHKTSRYTEGKYRQRALAPTQAEINRADVIIRPALSQFSTIDTSRRAEAIAAGELAAIQSLPAVAEAIAAATINPNLKPQNAAH